MRGWGLDAGFHGVEGAVLSAGFTGWTGGPERRGRFGPCLSGDLSAFVRYVPFALVVSRTCSTYATRCSLLALHRGNRSESGSDMRPTYVSIRQEG